MSTEVPGREVRGVGGAFAAARSSVILLLLGGAACAEAGETAGRGEAASFDGAEAGQGAGVQLAPAMEGERCAPSGAVRDCQCRFGGSGRQVCRGSAWEECRCESAAQASAAEVDGPADSSDSTDLAIGQQTFEEEFAPTPEPPTGVIFEWPETDPTRQSECRPGHYVGMFACGLRIVATDGPEAFELAGSIDMELEETADGELLRIANGKFESAAAVVIPAWGDVVGELDCSARRFEGRLENGHFSVALGLPVPFTEGTFSGALSADYDAENLALVDGAWDMTGELDGFPGSCPDGTWSAMRLE